MCEGRFENKNLGHRRFIYDFVAWRLTCYRCVLVAARAEDRSVALGVNGFGSLAFQRLQLGPLRCPGSGMVQGLGFRVLGLGLMG